MMNKTMMNKTPRAIVKRSQLVSGADSVNTYTGVDLLNQVMFLGNKTNCLFVLDFWILRDCLSVAIKEKLCLTSFFIQVVHHGMARGACALIWNRRRSARIFYSVEPPCNEPLYNEALGITNDFLYPSHIKIYEKELWPFVKSRFHCNQSE